MTEKVWKQERPTIGEIRLEGGKLLVTPFGNDADFIARAARALRMVEGVKQAHHMGVAGSVKPDYVEVVFESSPPADEYLKAAIGALRITEQNQDFLSEHQIREVYQALGLKPDLMKNGDGERSRTPGK